MQELDLALWRSAEAIASEQTEFMNDGEWELLSIPSHYWQLQQAGGEYAHIQFNVRKVCKHFMFPLSSVHALSAHAEHRGENVTELSVFLRSTQSTVYGALVDFENMHLIILHHTPPG